jgi:hypothetical protein
MATEAETSRHYHDAQAAALGERVTNLGRRQSDLEVEMRSGFRQIEQSFATFTNETRASIQALSSNLADRSRPQWQALGVMLTFVALLGALAYWPIREATADLKASVSTLAEKMVTRAELDLHAARGAEDRLRTEAAINELRTITVARNEWMERNQSRDHEIASIQRQIDDIKAAQSGIYGARDVLLDLRERLDRLERERAMRSPPPM